MHNFTTTDSRSATRTVTSALTAAGLGFVLMFSSCGGNTQLPTLSGASPGDIITHPSSAYGSVRLRVDESKGGTATETKLVAVSWGRMASVRDVSGALQNVNMVIGEDIRSDNINYELTTNPVTEETTVRILHALGTAAYNAAFDRLDLNLIPVASKSLSVNELPPFPVLPRNAALQLRFDDLLDPAAISTETVRMVTGYPAATPFGCRVILDPNFGDLRDNNGDGQLEFYPTRIILDPTVTQIEAGLSDPPLAVNNIGLPASLNLSQANVGVRIPTKKVPLIGQNNILTNLSGGPVSFTGSGSNDAGAQTYDIVRGLRSGGSTSTTGDLNNGFLVDDIPPRLVGVQAVQISTPSGIPGDFVTTVDYVLDACSTRIKAGDVIQQPGVFAEVTQVSGAPAGGTVVDVHYRIVYPIGGQLAAGPAQISTVWDPVVNFNLQNCFIGFTSVNPSSTTPGTGISTDSRLLVRFSEPMDPASLTAFDNMPITRVDPDGATPPTARDYIVGSVIASTDLKQYSFNPLINFQHTFNTATDDYFIKIGSGETGPVDLAGNPLAIPLPPVRFFIDQTDASENNQSLVFRFSSIDEIGNDTFPELRGQFLSDLTQGIVKPRPVTRQAATCDRTVPVPGNMPVFALGVQTPLAALGSKMQTIWRYCDVGFGLQDEATFNVDIEHLYWAPVGGNVVADSFDLFEMRLSHSNKLPDETIDPNSLLPIYVNSGLSDIYTANLLNSTEDPQRIVHPRAEGYVINPADRKISATGATTIMPWPLNQTGPVSSYSYYTWRDTAILAKGAISDAPGAELRIVCSVVFGLGAGCFSCPYTNSNVPTIGLPILMEFRCFPDSGALGLNALDINLAVNSSSRPNFRSFSTGGVNSSGTAVQVNPDLSDIASGGFNPTSTPPGAATLRFDNTVYLGEMDIVLRISRAHSIWFDSTIAAPSYLSPVVEPRDVDQPAGTRIDLAYRGAITVTPTTANILRDAGFIGPYGDPAFCPVTNPPAGSCPVNAGTCNGTVTFFQNTNTWRSSLSQINGAKFFQYRVTFVSNTETGLTPTLSALGFAFRQ